MTEAHIVADSVNTSGNRLTTFVLKYPRFIHAELMTHRALSRNSASSRAIPIEKMIQRVQEDPVIPYWHKAQSGMSVNEEVSFLARNTACGDWLDARDHAIETARALHELGIAKSVVNRLLEPWMHIEVVVSATEWNNFFLLRDDKAAEPHIRELAHTMKEAREKSTPAQCMSFTFCKEHPRHVMEWCNKMNNVGDLNDFHLPFIASQAFRKLPIDYIKESIAHCAWVSYLNEWKEGYTVEDVDRVYTRLLGSRPIHASPAEHVAIACDGPHRHGNFVGWLQWRKLLEGEAGGDYSG